MRQQFFTIPVPDDGGFADELNAFLSSHRITSIDRQLIHDGFNSRWAICVTYRDADSGRLPAARKPRVDYRELLNDNDFALFSRLRDLRKQLSERDGVPVYSLFNNEHLAAMATGQVTSIAGLQKIEGIGASRVQKYGADFIDLLQSETVSTKEEENEAEQDQS